MIRSRSIPTVLSRATGDGIHAILLIDADGELLGSYGNPPPQHHHQHHHSSSQDDNNNSNNNNNNNNSNVGTTTSTTANITATEKNQHWPLDAASIGALISEVAGDYRRMGDELLLLDPQYDSLRQSMMMNGNVGGDNGRKEQGEVGGLQQQDGSSGGVDREGGMGGVEGGSSAQTGVGGKDGKDKADPYSGTNLKSLVIELDYGVVGVASAGPDFYVIALADATVQHGALTGRLRSLGSHVREALSQLD